MHLFSMHLCAGPGPGSPSLVTWVADWLQREDRREVALALGGDTLLAWLLELATREEDHGQAPGQDPRMAAAQQADAERALVALLSSGGCVGLHAVGVLGYAGCCAAVGVACCSMGAVSTVLWGCFCGQTVAQHGAVLQWCSMTTMLESSD